ncbi:MAG: glycoside hydrolase family 25 protein [Anaerolineaceae bacterium]
MASNKAGEAKPFSYVLGMDVSQWQQKVDWDLLYSKGVRFAIVKLSQGNYFKDPMAISHVRGAKAAGLLVGLYHWHDPMCDLKSQLAMIGRSVGDLDFQFFALDVEQYWKSWMEWQKKEITKIISSAELSSSSLNLANGIKNLFGKKVVIYTRASFVYEHAAAMSDWLKDWDTWLAHYPFRVGRVSLSWEKLKHEWTPAITSPLVPAKCKDWRFWQWSGDKFQLPGVSTALDLNYFHGSENEMRDWLGLEAVELVKEFSLEEKVALLWNAHPEIHLSEV